ncbi:MAG: hypothetical protein K2G40_04965 [Muribaculaceae bacterium]|nr:hypothetical protein [Muribaculaceae bacterium]
MKHTSKKITLLSSLFFLATAICGNAENKTGNGNSESADNTKQNTSYPAKLIRDFPYIYADTAYSCEDYNVVVRAVWMAQRGRKTKVTSPDQLPAADNESCVRFTLSETKTEIQNSVTENKTER